MKKILLLAVAALALTATQACAQSQTSLRNVLQTCGTTNYYAGSVQPATQNTSGQDCVNAQVSATATITGFPGGATTNGTPMSVTNSSSATALPAGTSVNVFNTGANTAFVQLGASTTTAGIAIPPNSGCVLNVGSATQLAAITATSTTSLNLNGGSNFGSFCYGGGGSSGGGGGGNVTVVGPLGSQASTNGVSVTIASDQAAVAVKQATAANLNATVVGTGTLAVQNTAATPAGSNIIGNVRVDQTTPGTTNGVVVNSSALPTGAATSALQTTGNTSLGTIATNTTGASTAALQTTGNTSLGTIATNTTGLATASAQTTGNGSLSTIATNSGTQATAANQTSVIGSKNAGTAAASSQLVGGVYNSTPLTLTNTQQSSAQLDANGYLKVNLAAGGGSGGTSYSQGSTTSGQNVSPAGCATTTSAPTNTTAQTNMVSCDTSGALRVNVTAGGGTGGTSVAQGSTTAGQNVSPGGCATVSSSPTNTNAQTNMMTCDTSGNLNVNVKSATGVTQGSTTSGQSISPIGCRTLTSAPTDTTGQTNMPFCGTNGGLGVNILSGAGSGGTASSFGSAFPSTGTAIGAQNSSGMSGLISCDASVVYDASTNGSTQLVALSSGKTIYICGYSLFAAGTVNVELDYGTGTACVTSPSKIIPAYQFTAQTGMSDQSPFYRGLKTAASNELCLKTSAGVAVQAIVYYTQF